jgi:hypothetical protein
MSKAEFIDSIKKMDPKSRVQAVENSNVPEAVKREARRDAREHAALQHGGSYNAGVPVVTEQPEAEASQEQETDYFTNAKKERSGSGLLQSTTTGDAIDTNLKLVDSNDQEIPVHNVSASVRGHTSSSGKPETAAERRRREAARQRQDEEDSEDDGTERVPPRRMESTTQGSNVNDGGETAAERRRREGALGVRDESESEDEGPLSPASTQQVQRQSTLKWGKNVRG